jgi:hypothetical protein
MIRFYSLMMGLMLMAFSVQAQSKKSKNSQPQKSSLVAQSSPYQGFFDFYYHEASDKVYLKVPKNQQEFLYVNSLSQGIGNNDIGLDRGQLGNERIVSFSKAGNKLLLIQPNLRYRSTSDNPLEQRSIKEASPNPCCMDFP